MVLVSANMSRFGLRVGLGLVIEMMLGWVWWYVRSTFESWSETNSGSTTVNV